MLNRLLPALLAVCLVVGGNSRADGGVAVAIIDFEHILTTSDAGKAAMSVLGEERNLLVEEAGRQESELRERMQALEEKRNLVSEEVYTEDRLELEADIAAFQAGMRIRQEDLDRRLREATDALRKELVQVLGDLVTERGIDVVLDRHQYIMANNGLDVTDVVLARLNDRVSRIAVSAPSDN